jgi:CheY-like chemotaxis protein
MPDSGGEGNAVHVIRRQRSSSARRPAPRRLRRPPCAEARYRRDPWSARRPSDAGAGGGAGTEARHILIVDDEASIRLICSINFVASGWECSEAKDGEDGLDRIRLARPDIVLLDVMMPRVDGWTVAERLAADPATADVPVVFLTARAEQRDRERAHRLGAVGYLTKPLDPVKLPDQIDAILERLERGERDALRNELLEAR